MSNITTEKVRVLIKNLLRKEKQTYAHLATSLNISEPAVKRFMRTGDLTLERLEKIAAHFCLTTTELIVTASKLSFQPFEITEVQERLFVKNPIVMYVFLLLGVGLSYDEVKRRAEISTTQFKKYLLALDKVGLIEVGEDYSIRLIGKAPFKLVERGLAKKKYFSKFLKEIKDLVQEGNTSEGLQLPFELYVSDKLYFEFQKEISDVFKKYQGLSRVDQQITDESSIQPITGLFLIKKHDAWGKVLKTQGQ